jgi:primosomal protein N' (replication factor Y)
LHGPVHELAAEALKRDAAVLRLPPATDPAAAALVATSRGNALVLCPNASRVRAILRELQRAGVHAVAHPDGWATGAAGATVVGTRSAAWAPVGDLAAIVVVDEHDESLAQEQTPTWHARDVAIERARRAGVPCLLTSPCPSLEALAWGDLVVPARSDERSGWPMVDVIDRRADDPRTGLLSHQMVDAVRRAEGRVVCVLNRTGRARLLACAACGEMAACERCTAALAQPDSETLACPRCQYQRPVLCASCGAMKLKTIRRGVTRVREELEALLGEPVGELTGGTSRSRTRGQAETDDGEQAARRVVVGTEAALHQVREADVVVLLDLDQELLAPRYRAVEQAMGLVVRAARLLGGRAGGGRLVLQTRLPDHEVVQAALHADSSKVSAAEAERRELLRFPPAAALAEVSGAGAQTLIGSLGSPLGVEIIGPASKRWLLRATDHHALCDALAATPRPSARVRITVDPLRV